MKIVVNNKGYNAKIGVIHFVNGVAEIEKEHEDEARKIAEQCNFPIVEDEKKEAPKKEAPRKAAPRKAAAKKTEE